MEIKENMLDYERIREVEIENIDYKDYPDFCDAYILKAMYDDPDTGKYRELTEEELESLDNGWINEQVHEHIH
tara:strand:+ start:638 stop:856 length:219 start_codon:yes stop_codon:yes gene_type:complete